MGGLPRGKWTTDPPTKPTPWWVVVLGFTLLALVIVGTLYAQGHVTVTFQSNQPSVQSTRAPSVTTRPVPAATPTHH